MTPPETAAARVDDAWRDLLARGAPLFADAARLAQQWVRPDPLDRPVMGGGALRATLAHALDRLFELTLPGSDFIVVPGLPRPPVWPGSGALDTGEMRRLLRGKRA